MDRSRIQKLIASTKCRLIFSPRNFSYSEDFGGLIRRVPKIVALISCEQDICEILKFANAHKIPVSIRGTGHSINGQTLTKGIVIVNHQTRAKKNDIRLFEDGTVLVPTRLTWGALEKALNKKNRSCPVLTDNLKTTIGGTLSVGGIGISSLSYGAQIDQVVKLKLILPSGKILWCSPKENSDLFRFSLAGMGTLGVIESVILKTIAYKPVSIFKTILTREGEIRNRRKRKSLPSPFLPDLSSWIEETREIEKSLKKLIKIAKGAPRPNWAMMQILKPYSFPGPFSHTKYGRNYLATTPRSLRANTAIDRTFIAAKKAEKYLRRLTNCKNIWCDYLFKPKQAIEFLQFITSFVSFPLFNHLQCLNFLAIKRPKYAPHLPLHPARHKNTLYVSVGIYFSVEKKDRASEKKVVEIQKVFSSLLDKTISLGGRPYFYAEHSLNSMMMRNLFGNDYDRLVKLKKKHDPNSILSMDHLWLSTCHKNCS